MCVCVCVSHSFVNLTFCVNFVNQNPPIRGLRLFWSCIGGFKIHKGKIGICMVFVIYGTWPKIVEWIILSISLEIRSFLWYFKLRIFVNYANLCFFIFFFFILTVLSATMGIVGEEDDVYIRYAYDAYVLYVCVDLAIKYHKT